MLCLPTFTIDQLTCRYMIHIYTDRPSHGYSKMGSANWTSNRIEVFYRSSLQYF